MGENEYKIQLGVDIDVGDLQSQINKAGDKVTPIPIKVEIENLAEIKKQLQNLGGTKGNSKVAIPIDTASVEGALKEVSSSIKEIKTAIGTLDSKSGMQSLLSSINKISNALDNASDKFAELNSNLNALASKDFSFNIGVKLGGSNSVSNNATYGNIVKSEIIPELKRQEQAIGRYLAQYYKTDELTALNKLAGNSLGGMRGIIETLDRLKQPIKKGDSLNDRMREYQDFFKIVQKAANIQGVDLSPVLSGFDKQADELIKGAHDIRNGTKEAEKSVNEFENVLKRAFGSGINSEQLDSIISDLKEIKIALTDLSAETPLNQLKVSFDTLSNSITQLIQNCGNVKTVINEIGNAGANVGNELANGFDNSMESVQASAAETSGVITDLKKALETMHLDRSSIDAITKDIEELGFEATKASVKMKDGNFDITVQGVDSLGRAVTEMRHLDNASGKITGLGRTISQSFSTSDDVVRELNKEMADFVKLQSQIGNLQTKIGKLELVDGNENQVVELKRQLENLENTYDGLMQKFRNKLFENADIIPMKDVVKFDDDIKAATDRVSNELNRLESEYNDTRAKLAQEIKIKLNRGDFDAAVKEAVKNVNQLSGTYPKLEAGIEKVNQSLKDMEVAAGTDKEIADVNKLISAYEAYENILKSIKNQTRANKATEQINATDNKLDNDIKLFQNKIDAYLTKYSAAAKEFGVQLLKLKADAENCSRVRLDQLEAEFKQVDKAAEAAGKKTKTFGDSLKTQWDRYKSYFSIASLFMYGTQAMRDMFEQVKLIDTAMTELKKVTDETDASYNRFLSNAASKSKELGTTIDGLVESTADFARLGYGFEDSQKLAEVANIYAVVGDEIEGVEDATQSLVSTIAAFKGEMNGLSDSDFALSIVDKMNEVANNYSISSGGIGEALQRSASSMAAANNTLDETIAMITAANEVAQNPDKVGNALKTISMRIRGAKTELEEAGESTEGMVESTASLRAEIKALSGVDIMLNDNTFKSTYQIMDELSEKWKDLTDIQRASITELLAGKHQGNIMSSLMTNFDTARDALETSLGSEGSAMAEHAKWSESLEARLNKLSASWQAFAQAFMNSDALKIGVDALAGLVDILEKLIDNFGLLGTIGLGVAGKGIFSYFKGAKEAKATLNDVVEAIRETSNVTKAASDASVTSDEAEAAASEQAANAEMKEKVATDASTNSEIKEKMANDANAASENAEAQASRNSADAEREEDIANKAVTASEKAEEQANRSGAAAELQESAASAKSAAEETKENLGNVTAVVDEAAEATTNLSGAIIESGASASKSAGGFKAFASSLGGKIAIASIAISVISALVQVYKNYKEEISQARQETIKASDEFLDAAGSFEQAYIKYSGRTDLTVEEEKELESAINSTVDALGDKSSALQSAVNSSNDYVAALERITDAELEAANNAAIAKKNNAALELKDSTTDLTGLFSTVDVLTGKVDLSNTTEAVKTISSIVDDMDSDFLVENGNRLARTYSFELSPDADTDEIIDYYYTLVEYKNRLDEAAQDNPDILEHSTYTQVTNAIDKMSGAIEVYESGVFDAAKAQYQLIEGIPKTTEEYLKMREAILQSDDIEALPLETKSLIANTLDSEYGQMFDLSSAEVQARKFIGLIKGYGDGTKDGINEIGTVETFLNMRTAVNNNECTVGEYLAQFDEIDKMTANWSDEEKELLNTSFGLDTDTIKAQYEEMEQYLSRKIKTNVQVAPRMTGHLSDNPRADVVAALAEQNATKAKIKDFLNDLTAEELAAVIDIRTEIDWENTSAEDIRKQIADRVKLNEALNFNANIEVDKTALEALNTALEESASAMGLSEESIDSLKAKYSDLEGYNPHTLFEKTANGVKVNREELAKLEQKYNDLTKTEVQEHLDTLVEEYNKCTKAIDGNIGSQEKLELISKREKYAQQIEELAEYQSQLEGVTGAYQRWIDAQNTPEDYEGYQAVATGRKDIKDEIKRGFISNSTKEYIDLLSGEDLVGGTIDDYAEAWERLDKKVGSTSYSIHDFFTVNDDGDITSTGIDRFFAGIRKDFDGEVYKLNKETGEYYYDFSQENLKAIQDEWGIGIEAIELLLEAAASAGYDIDWGGIFDDLDIDMSNFESVEAMISLAEKAQEEFNKIKNLDDVEFNFRTNNIQDATAEVEKARKAYVDLITNDDGSINLKAEGAEQMQFMLATLLTQKQQLSTPAIMKVDTSQIDKAETDIIDVINKAKELQTAYENYEIAITTGVDVDGAKADLNSAIEGMKGTSVDVRADLKLPTNEELTNAANGIGSIKVGASLDGTSIGDIATKIQTECTPEVIAKVTGLDETAIQDGSQQVVYTAEHSDVDNFINGLTDISKKIIYTYATEGTKPNPSNIERSITYKYKTEGDVPEVNGTANVNGTAQSGRAFVRGNWGIKGSGTALVGELGMETLVRGGHFYTIGDSGAEFIKYKQGDIIFNHKQTEELFKNGKVTSDGGRGRMFVNGSAFADGTYPSSGKAFAYAATGSESNWVKNRTLNIDWDYDAKNTEKVQELFDWMEVAIERTEREIKNLGKTADNVYVSWTKRNNALRSQIDKVREEIILQNNAALGYQDLMDEIQRSGLSQDYIDLIKSGAIDIENITNEETADKIKDYQKYYELYLKCVDAAEDLEQTEAESWAQSFDTVISEYDGILQGFEHTESMLNEYISQAEAQGHIVSKEYYDELIKNKNAEVDKLKELYDASQDEGQRGKLETALNDYVNAMKAQDMSLNDIYDSEKYRELCAEIDSVTQDIAAAETATIEWNNAIRDIDWQVFDLMQERISDVIAEADFLIDLMSNKDLFDDNGNFTEQGVATMGQHGLKYNTYMYAADEYANEISKLDDQIASDPYDQELINRRRELVELQREMILAAEDEKNAIRDLVEEGIDIELDALQELIDKKNEELESEKDLYEYQKKVKEQTEEIASLEKQIAAYSGDNSEEARAKVQELKVSLEEAKTNLEETEYDKYLSDTQQMLDTLYDEYELTLNSRFDNIDFLLQQVIDGINAAAGAEGTITSALGSEGAIAAALGNNATTIKDTLKSETDKVGTTLSNEMNEIWSTGDGNAKSVITEYGKGFQSAQTTTNTVLGNIKDDILKMVDDVDKDAQVKVDSKPTKPSSVANSTGGSSGGGSNSGSGGSSGGNKSTGDGKPKIGDKVKFLNGKYYYDSQGVNPAGSKNHGKQVYITNINKRSWATHPYHISTGKKLGSGDLGWLKLNQLSDYATGKKNFLDNELAWTQEKGQEFIVRPSDGAILTPIAKGDSVLTSAASSNIWDMANSPAEFIKDNLNLGTTNVPNNSTVQSNYTQHLDKVIFNLPNVKNYDELLDALQKDPKFDKLIKAMTLDQIAGKSSLAKNKSIR